ncbi:RAMP superfamily CRISPR-associated protein [Methanothrix soehngenii]|jgi:hypothetical protein|nr:RAMP superfamily CRISPR-associated protein [Methanothrix soehngenii]
MSHYPNPFDFVPFPSAPIIRTEGEFDALGEKFSGYLELEIRALMPVHVVGQAEDSTERKSFFFRQSGLPCIPASSIRGCLRAFTEALTAGWVSRANPEYPKRYRGRHVGFKTFEDYLPDSGSRRRISLPAVDKSFKPAASSNRLDVASYLFGTVVEGEQTEDGEKSRKSKIWVEDAYLPLEAITFDKDFWAPDIEGEAFMGGAKPSVSNWWYFEPAEIWKRNLRGTAPVAEFIGEYLRGRKFYYHQDPMKCVQNYDQKKGRWDYHKNRFHRVRLECISPDNRTLPFRIYLDGVPQPLLLLLMSILLPGEHIRHKLGYAKAYGYGSIEFNLKSAKMRTVGLGIPNAIELREEPLGNLDMESLTKNGLADFIDKNALIWLARILGWPHEDLLFMYPQYRNHEFKQPINCKQFEQMANIKKPASYPMKIISTQQASNIAKALWGLKRPIDFRLYQERANGWNTIMQRKP